MHLINSYFNISLYDASIKLISINNRNETANSSSSSNSGGGLSNSSGNQSPLMSDHYQNFISFLLRLLPLICIFGVITNLLNIMVFMSSALKDRSFKYMLANSISGIVYLGCFLIDYYVFVNDNGDDVATKSFSAQLFLLLVDDYFTSCCAFFCILNDVFLSLERFIIVTNKRHYIKVSCGLILFIDFIASLLFYSPLFLLKSIVVEVETDSSYHDQKNQLMSKNFSISLPSSSLNTVRFIYATRPSMFSKSTLGKAIPAIISFFRIFLAIFFLSAINVVTAVKLKSFLSKRKTSKNSSKSL
jgi:hypothetical protein